MTPLSSLGECLISWRSVGAPLFEPEWRVWGAANAEKSTLDKRKKRSGPGMFFVWFAHSQRVFWPQCNVTQHKALDARSEFDSASPMGSQFMSLHLVEPALVQARLRGDFADLVEQLYNAEKPPRNELRPAFEVMARGTFVFLPKGQTHPEGLMYCRAVEHLLRTLGTRHWEVEFYPDEGESPLWDLAFGRCEAQWLDVPQCDSGIAVISWKSPDTCRSFVGQIRHQRQEYNPRYSPAVTLDACQEALEAGHSSGHGLFAIFQG